MLRLCHPKITYNHILSIWASWQQDHAISLLQKIWNVLGNKDYIDVKISHFPHIFLIISRDTWYSSKKKFVTSVFLKTVIELICDWNFKKTHPSTPKFPENLKNIYGVGRWCQPNLFPITAFRAMFIPNLLCKTSKWCSGFNPSTHPWKHQVWSNIFFGWKTSNICTIGNGTSAKPTILYYGIGLPTIP